MITLKDIKFESKRVGPNEDYPLGKSGCEMVAIYVMLKDKQEVIYVEHDYKNETITEEFKQRALESMNEAWVKYENKPTTKIKRWWRRWISLPKHRVME